MREDKAYATDRAIQQGDTAALLELLQNEPRLTGTAIPVQRDWGEEIWLPLHRACSLDRLEAAALLLQADASVDARTRFRTPMHARQTPLMLAAAGGFACIVELLLQHRADVHLIDANDRSALSHAAAAGHTQIIRRLIAAHAELDPVDEQHRTPLHSAIANGRVAAALALIEAGADPNHTCPKEPAGYTPLHRCASAGPTTDAIRDGLLQSGADPSLRDPRNQKTYLDLLK